MGGTLSIIAGPLTALYTLRGITRLLYNKRKRTYCYYCCCFNYIIEARYSTPRKLSSATVVVLSYASTDVVVAIIYRLYIEARMILCRTQTKTKLLVLLSWYKCFTSSLSPAKASSATPSCPSSSRSSCPSSSQVPVLPPPPPPQAGARVSGGVGGRPPPLPVAVVSFDLFDTGMCSWFLAFVCFAIFGCPGCNKSLCATTHCYTCTM